MTHEEIEQVALDAGAEHVWLVEFDDKIGVAFEKGGRWHGKRFAYDCDPQEIASYVRNWKPRNSSH